MKNTPYAAISRGDRRSFPAGSDRPPSLSWQGFAQWNS